MIKDNRPTAPLTRLYSPFYPQHNSVHSCSFTPTFHGCTQALPGKQTCNSNEDLAGMLYIDVESFPEFIHMVLTGEPVQFIKTTRLKGE